MWLRIFVLASFSALAGCAATPVVVCPPIREYDRAFMTRLADELDRAPAGSAMAQAVVDYRALRDVIRACERR
jgi:hypothetical protein